MGGAEYVAAGRFTVADISIGYALMLLKVTGLFDQAPASLQAYYGRLQRAAGVPAREGGAEGRGERKGRRAAASRQPQASERDLLP